MREILSRRGFSEEEITNLESREDYEVLREQIAGIDIDELLDLLEDRTEEGIESDSLSLEERWEHFKTTLRNLITERRSIQSETEETLDEMRERLTSEARTRAEEAIRNRVSWIPLIGERVGNWIIETMQQDQDETSSTVQSIVRNVLFTLATSIFGLREIVRVFQNEIYDAGNSELPEIEVPNVEIPEDVAETVDEVLEENSDEILYQAGVTALLSLSEEDNETTLSLLMHRSVKTSSYEAILASDFQLEGIQQEEITILQSTLRSQENLIESILHASELNWRNLPLLDIFKAFGNYGGIVDTFDSIRLEDFLGGGFNMFSLNISTDGIGGNLQHLFENLQNNESSALHGVSNGLILLLLRDNRKKISDEDIETLLAGNDYSTPEDQHFEEDFATFGREFINIIISDFYLGDETQRERFEAYFRTNSLTLQEVFEFYILTGGSRNPESYNDMVRTLIYLKVWSILGDSEEFGNSVRAATYDRYIIEVLERGVEEGTENIPDMFWTIARRIRENIGEGARELAGLIYEGFNALTPELKIIASVIGIGSAIYILRSRMFIRGLSIGGIATATLIYFIAEGAYANPDFRTAHPEYSSPDDVYSSMLDELEQEHNFDVTELREAHESGEIETSDERTDRRRQTLIGELAEDGMELAGVSEYTIGSLTVRRLGEEWRNYELAFYVNGERRSIYYREDWQSLANNTSKTSFFVRNSDGETFLAGWRTGGILGNNLHYVSLSELSERISTSPGDNHLILENAYLWYDLMLGAPVSE